MKQKTESKIDKAIEKLLEEAKVDLKIEKDSLDQDCIDQPELYLKWSERLNAAESLLKRTQNSLTQFKAEAYLEAKDKATASLKRITEGEASAAYRVKGKYKVLKIQEEQCERERQTLLSIVNAFVQRRSMLETLCRLHGQDYFHGGD